MSRLRRVSIGSAVAALVLGALAGCGGGRHTHRGPLEHYQMARVMFEQGKVVEAVELLEKSIAADGRNPQVHFYLGYVRWRQGEWAAAAASFEKALAINPYYTDARVWLGTCWDQIGEPDRALAEWERALADRTYPTPEQVHLNVALVRIRAGDREGGLESLRKAVELNPRYYRGHYELARLLDEAGRAGEALREFGVAEPGYREHGGFHLDYGRALFRANRNDEALAHLRKVLDVAPGSSDAGAAGDLIEIIEGS